MSRIILLILLATEWGNAARAATPGLSGVAPDDGPVVRVGDDYMVAYDERIPGTSVTFRMKPIPGGEFWLGSQASEADRGEDEGPRVRVRVEPMWVAACEVTWAEYRVYMGLYEPLKRLEDLRYQLATAAKRSPLATVVESRTGLRDYLGAPAGVDAITCPTPLYDASFTYEPGEDPRQPAVTMTQFAAKQYTKWLSGVTGRGYRLPTEAEWEYAARAGTETAFSFGDDPGELGEHAWSYDNADDRTRPVGTKRPNPWGLYDVHGNVAEWVLDEYDATHYATLGGGPTTAGDALRRATRVFPRAYRGGNWQDDAEALRSAARRGSVDDEWTLSDPNLPVSPWWYTEYESQGVGMRIVRPHQPMDEGWRETAWEADVEDLRIDIDDRVAEGRGLLAPVTPALPAALRDLAEASEAIDAAPE